MRSKTTRRLLLLSILVVSASAMPSGVLADARTEARRHFRRGMDLVVAGQVDAGVAELEEAYAILPHPNVLYNIGRAYAEVGRYDEAREYFQSYLESDPPDREEVRAIVAAIDQRIAARAVAAATPSTTGGVSTPTSPRSSSTVRVASASPEQIAELRATAAQFRSISQLSGSVALGTRADELDRLAEAMELAAAEEAATTDLPTETPSVPTTPVAPDEEQALAVAAQDATTLYQEEVVSSSRFAQSPLDAASATTVITRQDIRLSGLTSIPELLRRAAGVHVMSMTPADSEVAIRGFNRALAPRVVFLINGRSTYLDALGGNISMTQAVDVEDIERIEIVRGPASALYGANAFSGIVNIITRAPGDSPGTEVTIGGGNGAQLRGRVATSGRAGAFSYRLSSGYQQMNRWTSAFDPRREDLEFPSTFDPNLALREAHARADLGYRISDDVRLTAEGGFSHSSQTNVWGIAGFTDMMVRGPTSYAMTSLQTSWGSIRGFWNRYDLAGAQSDQGMPEFRVTGNTVDLEAVFARELQIGIPHNIHLGVGYRWKGIDWTIFDVGRKENHYALFFEDTMRVSDLVRITAGFRMDRHPIINKLIWSPRLALVLRPTEGQSIRVGGTSSFRTMSFAESYVNFVVPTNILSAASASGLGSVVATDTFGSRALRPERIITAEIGYLNQESDRFDFEVSAYFNRVWDFMELDSGGSLYTLADYGNPALGNVLGFDRATNTFLAGASRLDNTPAHYNVFGSEVGARFYPVDGLDIYANYSFNYAYNANAAAGEVSAERRQPRHIVNGGLQYRSRFGLDFGADVSFYTKTVSPETVLSSAGFEAQLIETKPVYLVNARLGYRMLRDRLELGVAAQNLTNNRVRMNPFGQAMSSRVMATLTARF